VGQRLIRSRVIRWVARGRGRNKQRTMTAILLTLAGLVGTMLASMACLIFHCWELGAEANRIANNIRNERKEK